MLDDDERFWRRVAASSLDPVLVLDSSHRIEFVSDSITAELGGSPETLVGCRVDRVVLDAEGSSISERLDRSDPDVPTEFGVTLAAVSGQPVHTRAVVRRDTTGDTLKYVVLLRGAAASDTAVRALRRRIELEQLLERVQRRFGDTTPSDVGPAVTWALREVGRYLGADRAYVLEFDHDAGTETMVHEWAAPGVEPELGEYVDVSWDLAPAAARRNNDNWISAVPDVSRLDGEWATDRRYFEEQGIRSIVELPVVVDGHAVGGLGFDWMQQLADWTEDDLTVLGLFASAIGQLLGREAAEREMARRTTHDELTGLPNRAGILDRLRSVLDDRPAGSLVGALVIDVDQFKVVNDSLGNEAGDDLLRLVGARLRGLVRPGDVVARLGGDEFAVVLPDAGDEWTVHATSERLRSGLAAPYTFHGRTHLLTVSCGIATAGDEHDGVEAAELLRRAGAAMYRAKEEGRARQAVFDAGLEQRMSERLELDQRLRLAVDRGEFEVHYQPEVELATGRVVGAEALLRWRADGVLRDAGTFIDVVEETGLIVPVGRWVLEEACAAAARWHAAGVEDFVMRVNLSPRQLEHPGLVELVASLLDEHGLHPSRLCLEITETALMGNAEAALGLLERLDGLGVSLAIDDFGTGYSSLSYLKRFPVDILKIDRSFVDGLPGDGEDVAIVTTIVRLAELLGMRCTAEGIETAAQAEALVGMGCDRGQGWWFSRAVPAAALEEMLGLVDAATPARRR